MIQKAFRPAPTWEGERAGTDHLAWQQISVHINKTSLSQQEISIINYSVDARLNVVRVYFGPRRSEVQP